MTHFVFSACTQPVSKKLKKDDAVKVERGVKAIDLIIGHLRQAAKKGESISMDMIQDLCVYDYALTAVQREEVKQWKAQVLRGLSNIHKSICDSDGGGVAPGVGGDVSDMDMPLSALAHPSLPPVVYTPGASQSEAASSSSSGNGPLVKQLVLKPPPMLKPARVLKSSTGKKGKKGANAGTTASGDFDISQFFKGGM